MQYHDKVKHELWLESNLDKKPDHIFEEIMVLFLKDSEEQKRYDAKLAHARYWTSVFGGQFLSSITGEKIMDNIPTHHAITKRPISNGTKNRYRASILRAFSLAQKIGWIDSVPYIPRMNEPKIRVRWITKEKANILISNLNLDWMKNVCSFALMTGARMSEILSLTWANINLTKSIAIVTNDNAKSGRARPLPLNRDAIILINSLPRGSDYVFTRSTSKRVFDIDRRDFKRACDLSGIENFHFHDLRHTWASWHVQAGTPLFTLKEMGGWETLEMVKKYAHLNADHLSKFSNMVSFWSHSEKINNQSPRLRVVTD